MATLLMICPTSFQLVCARYIMIYLKLLFETTQTYCKVHLVIVQRTINWITVLKQLPKNSKLNLCEN